MAVEREAAPHRGVYIPLELRFLRGIVCEVLRTASFDLDREDAETIARDVMVAYREGVMDREELLQVARRAVRRRQAENFYDRAGGLFA